MPEREPVPNVARGGGTANFGCKKLQGRYVTITIPGIRILSLCEVQVFGEKLPSSDSNVALAGEASQSSNIHSLGAAGNAIDGSTSSDFIRGSCTHTHSERNPWWMVDLNAQYQVFRVSITNRKDCCAHRLNGAEIRVGDSAERGGTTNPRCATISSLGAGETGTFNCEASKGQYVTVTLPRKEYLTLCEVQVFGQKIKSPDSNVALAGEASQSSNIHLLGAARNAIDGSTSSDFIQGSCTHTDSERNPWWMVDLKAQYQVLRVSITNRKDCCAQRLNGAEIRVGDSAERGGTTNPRCATISSLGAGETDTFNCESSTGQFVTVTLPRKDYLTLCEVQVFGQKIESTATKWKLSPFFLSDSNVALAGEASQSSNIHSLGAAGNAIDGSTSSDFIRGSCTRTDSERNPWWMVDLNAQYQVFRVSITNRKDCCAHRLNGAEIRVGDSAERGGTTNPRCATISSLGAGETGTFNCEASKGQYVTVTLPRKEYLTLCEVQVFGRKIESPGT
ncbi:uncharacterized protein LOC118091141 [Zootoca vivipara]|uniref:uncharacterized protein LOC118091141 n=1 Tax=Zootoca vivipara TaxID=8524 RepID=UPI00293BCB30|nr:uncharacterized protein LOC118091141 [Zootoca vivipara]